MSIGFLKQVCFLVFFSICSLAHVATACEVVAIQNGLVEKQQTTTTVELCSTVYGYDVVVTFQDQSVMVERTFACVTPGPYRKTVIEYPRKKGDVMIDVWVQFLWGDEYYFYDTIDAQWYVQE